mgnify:CR=1 FL=1
MALSFELQPVNEPAALESDARSNIRIDLARESRIGAWATLFPNDHPTNAEGSEPNAMSRATTNPTDHRPFGNSHAFRHLPTPLPYQETKSGRQPTVRLDKGLPIGGTQAKSKLGAIDLS